MKKLAHVFATLAVGGVLASGIAAGCGGSGHSSNETCTVGDLRDCNCGGLEGGMQTCVAGSWSDCGCGGGTSDAGSDAAAVCGDNVCESGENCVTCPADCGECPA